MLELFERDDDGKAELALLDTIELVNVRRCETGRWESVARQYEISELSTVVQVFHQLGGGSFEFIGRNQKGQIIRRAKHVIAPPPGHQTATAQPEQVQAQPVQVQMQAGPSSFEQQMMLMMMKQSSEMTMAMVQLASSNADKHVSTMTQLFASMNQNTAAMLDRLMAGSNGRDPENLFLKGVETMNELRRGANGEPDNDSGSSASELLTTVGQGVQLAQSMGIFPGGPGAPPTVPVP
jgi:hypothetical protein